jgi:radical SAM protein with 4Fe4S-binding SPASM domain
MSDFICRYYKESDFFIFFDQKNGTFIRYGRDDVDPFYNVSGPELLDISITNFCQRGCEFCYRKSHKNGKFMPFEDYLLVMAQANKVGVTQVALGGGNPNQHPQFSKILQATRAHNIVPSYTTNGQGMTSEIYAATKDFCGALAVSWYEPYIEAKEVIRQAKNFNIKLNIHFLLNDYTLAKAIDLLENRQDILQNVNAIVFLNYKPIHSSKSLCLSNYPSIEHFLNLISNFQTCKVGFDSCMISYLSLIKDNLVIETSEFCEAARFSAFVSEDLLFYPCSFLNDVSSNGIDLKTTTLTEAWQYGEEFIRLRKRLETPGDQVFPIKACETCSSYTFCHGGCQIFDINRCRDQNYIDNPSTLSAQ